MEKRGGEALPAAPWAAHQQVPKFAFLEHQTRRAPPHGGDKPWRGQQGPFPGSLLRQQCGQLVKGEGQARGSKAIRPLAGDLGWGREWPLLLPREDGLGPQQAALRGRFSG